MEVRQLVAIFLVGMFAGWGATGMMHCSFDGWVKPMTGAILTDSSGVVYRVSKIGYWQDSRTLFERQELIPVTDSTYEIKWHNVNHGE